MPIPLKVRALAPVFAPYAAFKTPYDHLLLQLFRDGATLYVWRSSNPYNWYLATSDGERHYVDGCWEAVSRLGVSSGVLRALRVLSRPAGAPSPHLGRSTVARERGVPQKEGWLFDSVLAEQCEQRWVQAGADQATHQASARPPTPALAQLSPLALALFRTLQLRGEGVARFSELSSLFSELDDQGLLELTRKGVFRLVTGAARLRLPRGLSLDVRPS
jgi:hypothetical protein